MLIWAESEVSPYHAYSVNIQITGRCNKLILMTVNYDVFNLVFHYCFVSICIVVFNILMSFITPQSQKEKYQAKKFESKT